MKVGDYMYIIRECENADFDFFFDNDCFSSAAGDFCYTVFTITSEHYGYTTHFTSGINEDVFETLWKEKDYILTDIDDYLNGYNDYKNIKEIMKDYNLSYNPKNAHTLKMLTDKPDDINTFLEFLKIKTNKEWHCVSRFGYCQGDFVNVVFCPGFVDNETAKIIGDIYLGCGKEFSVIELDENGNEIDEVFGFYVADCQGYKPDDYKRIVSADFGIKENDSVKLELIENYTTIRRANYVSY